MSIPQLDVAIVGAGLAGLSCAAHLHAAGRQVTLFEKARGVGGRLSTRRTEHCTFDHGAQYFTARDPDFCAQVARWQQHGVVHRWDAPLVAYQAGQWQGVESIPRYVGVPRMSSIARHMLGTMPCHLQHRLIALEHDGQRWCLQFEGQPEYHAQTVVLALPAPQVLPFLPSVHPWHSLVQSVQMQATWAVMLELATPIVLPYGGIFVNDQHTLSWIACDHSKPERAPQSTWVLHSNPKWAAQQVDADPHEVAEQMIAAFAAIVQQPILIQQRFVHRWLYALADQPLAQHSLYAATQHLGVAGDWLSGSRVEGAWCSGRHLAQSMLQQHAQTQPL